METEGAPQNQDLLMIVQNFNKKLTVSQYCVTGDGQESTKTPYFNQPRPKHLRETDFLMMNLGT